MPSNGVVAAYLHPQIVSHSFMDSMFRVFAHESARGTPCVDRWGVKCGAMAIPDGRNLVFDIIMDKNPPDHVQWVWWTDTDMGFRPDTLQRLLEAADARGARVISAPYYGYGHGPSDGMGGFMEPVLPMVFDWLPDDRGFARVDKLPEDAVVPIAATGMGCTLVHRTVIEEMADRYGREWFSRVRWPDDGPLLGEDMAFFYRCGRMGIQAWMHTGIPTTHHKSHYLGHAEFGVEGKESIGG